MDAVIRTNYAGMMPDELPRGLSDSEVTTSLEVYFSQKGEGVRTLYWGGFKAMNCLEKVIFFVLDFFGISTASRAESVQYELLKLLHIAHVRDLLKGDLEKMISQAQIDNLLIGVAEGIRLRHNEESLKKSIYNFAVNHDAKPGILVRLFSRLVPEQLYQHATDFGITHLYYAEGYALSCPCIVQPHVKRALSYINKSFLPSDRFCMKFVEIMRRQKDVFAEEEATQEEQEKIDLILRKALRALAKEKRYQEAAATITELRVRLLEQDHPTNAEYAQLAILKDCQGEDCEETLNKIIDLSSVCYDDSISADELTNLILLVVIDCAKNYTTEKVKEKQIDELLPRFLDRLIMYDPTRLADALVSLFHIGAQDKNLDPKILTQAMLGFYSTYGGFTKEWIMMAEAAYHFATNVREESLLEVARDLGWDRTTLYVMSKALKKDELFPEAALVQELTTLLGEEIPKECELLEEAMDGGVGASSF